MSWTTSMIDSVANTYRYWNTKFNTPRKAPRYIAAEIGSAPAGVSHDVWRSWDEEKKQLMATRISWIYSNVIRIANEVSAAGFNVFKSGTNEKDIDHPFEKIMQYPNEFFDGATLLRYTIWGLSMDEWGAYWFLAPDSKTGQIREIWPIPLGRLTPVKDRNKFISHYLYKSKNSSEKPIKINPRYICRFIYAHPTDLWKSLTPLSASTLAMSVYDGLATAQRDLFQEGRGVPLSIISLDPNLSDPDFASARERLRQDWEEERKVAIVRAGSMDIQTVGLTNQQLRIIESLEQNRDEIDAIFMGGISWRSSGASGEERDSINKEIKENVIFPLHRMLAAQIQLHIINPFYGEQYLGKFDDVRAQDRSIQIQERTIYWRAETFDEARRELGLPEYDDERFPDFGELPLQLAINPAFILKLYGLGDVRDPNADDPDVGNIAEAQDPGQMANQIAGSESEPASTDVKMIADAAVDGLYTELKRYRKVLLRTWRKHETTEALVNRQFDTHIIPENIMFDIAIKLDDVSSEDDILKVFDLWLK